MCQAEVFDLFVVNLAYSVAYVVRFKLLRKRVASPPSSPAIALMLSIDITVNTAREESGSP